MREYSAVINLLLPVCQQGRSFDASHEPAATPLAKEIAFGVMRHYFSLTAVIGQLMKKPLPDKHLDLRILLLAGIYSIDAIRRPPYASVNEAVSTVERLGKDWAKGMVNGVLRNYLRNKPAITARLAADLQADKDHPAWLVREIEAAWPAQAARIITANNARAPMTLRVNAARTTASAYQDQLARAGIASRPGKWSEQALYLDKAVNVSQLPGFDEGLVSVQDEASQLAAGLVDNQAQMRTLDACAAPGGKTCHLLELVPGADVTAIDVDTDRLRQLRQNLNRLGLSCRVETGDLRRFQSERRFQRILLDAPCSATGIIRRHPDIKLLRRQADIAKLVAGQTELLTAAWQLLEPDGVLIYSTCSILPAENEGVLAGFLEMHPDAAPAPIKADWGADTGSGRQLLPVVDGHDGFFYARLVKRA